MTRWHAGLSQCNNLTTWASARDCLPNWLEADVLSPIAPMGHEAMLCPQLTFRRPADFIPVSLLFAVSCADQRATPQGSPVITGPGILLYFLRSSHAEHLAAAQYIYQFNLEGLQMWLGYLNELYGNIGMGSLADAGDGAERLSLLEIPPSLYGFRECICLHQYHPILTIQSDGEHIHHITEAQAQKFVARCRLSWLSCDKTACLTLWR